MKVLHVITSLQTGGAEKLMVDLLPRLRKIGADCALLTFDGRTTPFKKELEKSGIEIHDFGSEGKSPYSLKNLIKLVPFLRRYDIVHTHNTAPQLFAALGSVLCSVELCTTEHNTANRRRDWQCYAPIDRWMYSRYKKVICISDKTEENLRTFIKDSSEKFSTIYNGIDTMAYHDAASIDIKSSYDGCTIALIHVAGFRYQKDQDTVIRALALLPEYVHLFLVGDGARRHELEMLVDSLNLGNRVHMLGCRSDVAGLLKGSDIAVMSSHWEGFGLAAVEAMAAGLPVVASDIDGLAQVVGDSGILFEHGNEVALSEAILSLVNNSEKRKYYSEMGIRRSRDFDISKMASEYLSIYNEILGE